LEDTQFRIDLRTPDVGYDQIIERFRLRFTYRPVPSHAERPGREVLKFTINPIKHFIGRVKIDRRWLSKANSCFGEDHMHLSSHSRMERAIGQDTRWVAERPAEVARISGQISELATNSTT
jgi:hypothetical protein